MLLLYGHCPNSFRPPHPLCQTSKCGNVPQTILASLYTNPFGGNAHLWKQHILKGPTISFLSHKKILLGFARLLRHAIFTFILYRSHKKQLQSMVLDMPSHSSTPPRPIHPEPLWRLGSRSDPSQLTFQPQQGLYMPTLTIINDL